MSKDRDFNGFGDQTIEGTEPPIVFDAEVVMPDGSSRPAFDTPSEDRTVITPPPLQDDTTIVPPVAEDTVITPPPASDDAIVTPPQAENVYVPPQEEAIFAPPPPPVDEYSVNDVADLDAQLDAILSEPGMPPPDATQQTVQAEVQEQIGHYLNEQLNQLLDEQEVEDRAQEVAQEQIGQYLDDQLNILLREQEREQYEAAHAEKAEDFMNRTREMVEQALSAQTAQNAQPQPQPQPQVIVQAPASAPTAPDPTAEAAKEMLRQAQQMMQQAQEAQLRAQQEREAQLRAQSERYQQAAAPIPDGSNREVDRLKAEIDSMRDLINKLTVSLAQAQAAPQPQQSAQTVVPPPVYFGATADTDNGSRDRYRRLEDDLDRMRRELVEKELREKEREIERKQKEAEKDAVKNISPDMIQMSDSRDVAPTSMPATGAGEYIPLANGVFYSVKDKQVYVMTPASQAANTPVIETTKKTTVKRPAPRPAPARKAAPRRSAGSSARRSSLRHRPPRRPTRPTKPHR